MSSFMLLVLQVLIERCCSKTDDRDKGLIRCKYQKSWATKLNKTMTVVNKHCKSFGTSL